MNLAQHTTKGSWACSIDMQFVEMLHAYRPNGGIARRSEIDDAVGVHPGTTPCATSRWLEDGSMFAFVWRDQQWIPRFQLHHSKLRPIDGVLVVTRELRPAFDDWALAAWFAQPNDMLGGATPADHVARNVPEVLQAARLARYIAGG